MERGAEDGPAATIQRCVYGVPGSTEKIAVVGDSIAISWLPAVEAAYPNAEIHVLTMQQCPFAHVSVNKGDGSAFPECDSFHDLVAQRLAEIQPTLTVLSQAENSEARRTGHVTMSDGVTSAVTSISSVSSQVAILAPPPQGPPVTECFSSVGRPYDCVSAISTDHRQTLAYLTAAVDAHDNVRLLDTDQLFCAGDMCSAMVGGVIVRADRAHLTQEYAGFLGPALRELIDRGPE